MLSTPIGPGPLIEPEPVTVGQVIEMSKEGMPTETIVKKMRD